MITSSGYQATVAAAALEAMAWDFLEVRSSLPLTGGEYDDLAARTGVVFRERKYLSTTVVKLAAWIRRQYGWMCRSTTSPPT